MGMRATVERLTGVHFYRPNPFHMVVDYPVSVSPRYGYKQPAHPIILDMIETQRAQIGATLERMQFLKDACTLIPVEGSPDARLPFWNNVWLPPQDGLAMMHFLTLQRPKRFLEIGSGFSTKYARHAVDQAKSNTILTSIDPQPRAEIDSLCDKVIRCGLEDVDLTVFDELEAGDILSFDGSHRTLMDSDVTVFFLDVLPRLAAGVIVQVHDIFWPNDYPPSWGNRYYSEQYMLGLYLIAARDKVEILLPNAFIAQDAQLRAVGERNSPIREHLPSLNRNPWTNAFWFKVTAQL